MKKTKRLKASQPQKGKRIKPPESSKNEVPAQQRKPLFSFQNVQKNYCISLCDLEDRAQLALTLLNLSQLTWAQLHQAGRLKLGYEIISRKSISGRLPPCIKEDTNLIAFRFSGMKPMVGYRENEVFNVVWLDRDFTLYDHGS
jgi:hypothetical protein